METLEDRYIKGDWTPPFLVQPTSQPLAAEVPTPRESSLKRKGNFQAFFYTYTSFLFYVRSENSVNVVHLAVNSQLFAS